MTVEPKFVPSSGANIKIEEFTTNFKLIDCVGFVTPESIGYTDPDGHERMIKTPWFTEDLPFVEALQAIINAVLLVVFLIYLSNEHLLAELFGRKNKQKTEGK